jgi:hypothetical protein
LKLCLPTDLHTPQGIPLTPDNLIDNMTTRTQKKAAAIAHLKNEIFTDPEIQAAFDSWGVTEPTNFLRMTADELNKPYKIGEIEKTLSTTQKARIMDCRHWYLKQPSPNLEMWLDMDATPSLVQMGVFTNCEHHPCCK